VKKNLTFLTNGNYDKKLILKTILEHQNEITNEEDKGVLENILNDFKNDDFSLITPQEAKFLELNDFKILIQYLIFRYKFKKYPSIRKVHEFPIYLLIEPVSACNLRCVMCFQVDETFNKNSQLMGKMDFELFKKIIDEAYEGGTRAITLASRGEPTLHPKLGEMIEYCSDRFFELKINTNATRLNEKLIHQILKNGITDLVFSIDSHTKEEYEKIRVKGNFDVVLNNIKKFKEIREKDYPNSRCVSRISGVKINPEQDPLSFKKFWEQYVDHVVMVEMEQRWDTYHNPIEIGGKNPCEYLWERMYVWFDGICNPCDSDYKSELSVGSVKENTISEIWHSQKYKKIREFHLSGNRKECYPCDRCPVDS
jgi:radical SAM protein with 4Fe4S-binding SPASM domain